MKIIGITGPIASGKSRVAFMLQVLYNAKVFYADRVVYALYKDNRELFKLIQHNFPEAIVDGRVISKALLATVVRREAWLLLESIVHPFVMSKLRDFIALNRRCGSVLVVLDIPFLNTLLGKHISLCSVVVMVKSNLGVQQCRMMDRPGCMGDSGGLSLSNDMMKLLERSNNHNYGDCDLTLRNNLGKAEVVKFAKRIIRAVS